MSVVRKPAHKQVRSDNREGYLAEQSSITASSLEQVEGHLIEDIPGQSPLN